MTDNRAKSPEAAEREVAAARADLRTSIGDLEACLSPDILMDRAMTYLRTDGRRHASALTRQAQANPVAVTLIGVGLAWLVAGAARSSPNRRDSEPAGLRRGTSPTSVDTSIDTPAHMSKEAETSERPDLGQVRRPVVTGLGDEPAGVSSSPDVPSAKDEPKF